MATTYLTPGIYVEEVASINQTIAGVGTSTAAFIGIVPDVIHCPVACAGYDPVVARDEHLLQQSRRGNVDPDAKAQALARLKGNVTTLTQELAKLKDQATLDQAVEQDAAARASARALRAAKAAQAALPAEAAAADTQAAQSRVETAQADDDAARNSVKTKNQAAIDEKQAEVDRETRQIEDADKPADAAPAAADYPSEDAAYDNITVKEIDPPLLKTSASRPYYLAEKKVKAAAYDTKLCTNFSEYCDLFGDFSAFGDREVTDDDGNKLGVQYGPLYPGHHFLTHAVQGFFLNGGSTCFVVRIPDAKGIDRALLNLESIDAVAIVAAPGLPKSSGTWETLQDYCESEDHQNVFAILDCPGRVEDKDKDLDVLKLGYGDPQTSLLPRTSDHAAFYFPYIEVLDRAKRLQDEDLSRGIPAKYRGRCYVPPSGHIAGIYARTDEERGVHKAPANAVVRGALEVKYYVSKAKQGLLNPQGVNCIRLFSGTVTVWGARTIGGDRNGEFKYVSVRRFMGYLERSIDEGTQWIVFEPNDPGLWSKIRLNVTAFLTNVWRNGALFGTTPQQAFYVKCDEELNPPSVRDQGQVVIEIGVAIVRPAEFVIFRISQSAGLQPS